MHAHPPSVLRRAMGFSLLVAAGSHVSMSNHGGGTLKFPSFAERERHTLFIRNHRAKPRSGAVRSRKDGFSDFEGRASPDEVKKEIEQCYKLIHRLGRGVVYLGSSRMGPDHSFYSLAQELGREVANILDCTSWTGAGPGLMDAVIKGALQAGKPVGGFKIRKEAGEWTASNFHPYLPLETYLTCRFFSARKHGLVDAAVRNSRADKTAIVALPGGIGTLDELFEILALIQLERIGSNHLVPVLLMNYDSFYSKLLDFFDDCEDWGTVSKGEVASVIKVCGDNSEALGYLGEFYRMPVWKGKNGEHTGRANFDRK